MTPPVPPSLRNAFTLTELLVTIAAVAALFALLFPALGSLRTSSLEVKCTSNLKATGIFIHSYVTDNNGIFDSFARGTGAGAPIWGLGLYNKKYINDATKSVLRCPAARNSRAITDPAWYWNTYGFNMAKPDGTPMAPAGTGQGYTIRFSSFTNFSQRVMLVDSATTAMFEPGVRSESFRVNILKVSDGVQLRHRNRANALFMDGHVEALDREEVKKHFNPEYIFDANQTH